MAIPKKPAASPADPDQRPATGGSYIRHEETGDLTRVAGTSADTADAGTESAPTPAAPAATPAAATVATVANQE